MCIAEDQEVAVPAKSDRIDEAVLSMVGAELVAIRDLTQGGNYRTVRAAVERLHRAGRLDLQWDGNERFGRYLYFAWSRRRRACD